jgi:hypothetical protein
MATPKQVADDFKALEHEDQLAVLKDFSVGRLLRLAHDTIVNGPKKDDEDELIAGEIDDVRRRYVGKHES